MRPPRHALQWVEVDGNAIRHNLRSFQRFVGPITKILPVIKGNAYGHGMVETAHALAREPVWGFGVANFDDVTTLRRAGIRTRLLVLSYYSPAALTRPLSTNVSLVVFDLPSAQKLNRRAAVLGRVIPVHLKIDTGTNRIGIAPDMAGETVAAIRRMKNLKLEGVFSHLADAENGNQVFTSVQQTLFNQALSAFPAKGKGSILRHLACTAAGVAYPATRYDLLRLGLGLYGLWPAPSLQRFAQQRPPTLQLQPALQWKARLIQVKYASAGATIGYGRTYTVRRRLRYGIVPVGYWDGYDRWLSNRGTMLVRGKRCPVLGRVCMNMTMIGLQAVPHAKAGDEVVLLGKQGHTTISAEELAEQCGTINYEITTRINPLTPRYLR